MSVFPKLDMIRIKEMKWILALLIFGDWLTTTIALSMGFGLEANPITASLISNFGFGALLLVKILLAGVVYYLYPIINNNKKTWFVTKTILNYTGLVVCANNCFVILQYLML